MKIFEISTVNSPKFANIMPKKYIVKVNSKDHNPPHFHYIFDDVELKIDIFLLTIIHGKNKNGTISNKILSWEGFRTEKDVLYEWIISPHHNDKKFTNYQKIIMYWNGYMGTDFDIFSFDKDLIYKLLYD
jgi:hypothetical protein